MIFALLIHPYIQAVLHFKSGLLLCIVCAPTYPISSRARTAYRVHSPFVYTFYQEVLRSPQPAIAKEIEAFRRTLSQDQTPISYEDLGAGSHRQPGTRVNSTVGQLAHRAARRARVGSFLYHVCRFYQPQQLLELGTHLGFSALYQIRRCSRSNLLHH